MSPIAFSSFRARRACLASVLDMTCSSVSMTSCRTGSSFSTASTDGTSVDVGGMSSDFSSGIAATDPGSVVVSTCATLFRSRFLSSSSSKTNVSMPGNCVRPINAINKPVMMARRRFGLAIIRASQPRTWYVTAVTKSINAKSSGSPSSVLHPKTKGRAQQNPIIAGSSATMVRLANELR